MRIEDIFTLSLGTVSVVIPLYIYLKSKSDVARFIFGFLGFIAGPIWSLAIVLFRESVDPTSAIFWNKMIYVVAVLVPPLFFWFSILFPVRKHVSYAWKYAIMLTAALFMIFVLTTDLLIAEIIINNQGNNVVLGPAYPYWLAWFVVIMLGGALNLLSNYRTLTGVAKDQAKYIVIGSLFPAVGTLPTNAFLPLWGIYQYIWIGPLFLTLMNLIVAYGITRTRFFNIKIVYSYLLKVLLNVLFIIIVLFISENTFGSLFDQTMDLNHTIITVFILFFFGLSMNVFLDEVLDKVERLVFTPAISPVSLREQFIKKASTELNLDRIAQMLFVDMSKLFSNDKVGLIVLNEDMNTVLFSKVKGSDVPKLNEITQFIYYWDSEMEQNEPIVLSEIEFLLRNSLESSFSNKYNRLTNIKNIMNKYGMQIVLPLNKKVQLYGIFMLGDKPANESYKIEDIELIESYVSNVSVAIGRSVLFQEVKNFNVILKEKVDGATVELREKVSELEDARRKENDMIDIMGHELRTPASIVKMNVSMLENWLKKVEQDIKTIDSIDEFKKYTERIRRSIDNEIKIINTLLASAKLVGNQLVLNKEPVDVISAIDMAVDGLQDVAKGKGLLLSFNKKDNGINGEYPLALADRARFQEIIDNLISNAIKYTDSGSIKITVTHDEKLIRISVKDTGIGIPPEDLAKLGQKFFRTNQYLGDSRKNTQLVRPGGTGLGLFVVFGLINEHGGEVIVDSKVGEGSTFTVTIPIALGAKRESASIHNNGNQFEKLKNITTPSVSDAKSSKSLLELLQED